jgi:hypothetical protein
MQGRGSEPAWHDSCTHSVVQVSVREKPTWKYGGNMGNMGNMGSEPFYDADRLLPPGYDQKYV